MSALEAGFHALDSFDQCLLRARDADQDFGKLVSGEIHVTSKW